MEKLHFRCRVVVKQKRGKIIDTNAYIHNEEGDSLNLKSRQRIFGLGFEKYLIKTLRLKNGQSVDLTIIPEIYSHKPLLHI